MLTTLSFSLRQDAAVKGMVIWGFLGAGTCFLAHNMFPAFRSQTLALKGFLTTGSAIFGLVTGAEAVLQDYESQQRSDENLIRDRARTELGKKGMVASEAEIEKWKLSEREKLLERYRLRQDEANANKGEADKVLS